MTYLSQTYPWYDKAASRVAKDKSLWRYEKHLLYPWEDGPDAHYEWVATAPKNQLLTWCHDFDK